jgi:hypothetical protein
MRPGLQFFALGGLPGICDGATVAPACRLFTRTMLFATHGVARRIEQRHDRPQPEGCLGLPCMRVTYKIIRMT